MKKGPLFEKQVAEYLAEMLGLPVERRVMGGINDRGDIAGVPHWHLEVKNCRSWRLAEWVDEARREAGDDFYGVILKRPGKGHPAQAYVVMDLDVLADLIRLFLDVD